MRAGRRIQCLACAPMLLLYTLQAPLILGNDIPAMDNVTLGILSNPHAIAVNQVRNAFSRLDALVSAT